MVTDKHNLYLATAMLLLFFFSGVFDMLDNFMIIVLLLLLFIAVFANVIMAYKPSNEDEIVEDKSKNKQ
ncbi:hypothetical protein [Lacinutrix salivirga]